MALPQPKKSRYTPEEYYALEAVAEYKSDYCKGEIFNMAGGTSDHSLITANVLIALGSRLRGKPCRVYESNLRLLVRETDVRTYPDVSIYCGPVEYDLNDPQKSTALNPTLIVEVLSPSTEACDRGLKAESYRRIPSLRAYVLVSQNRASVEVQQRQQDRPWTIREAAGLEATIRLAPIEIDLPLAEVYSGIEFPETIGLPRQIK